MVELINALPKPVTVPCVLQTSDRPLENCEPLMEPDRCATFDSIFAHGEVTYRPHVRS